MQKLYVIIEMEKEKDKLKYKTSSSNHDKLFMLFSASKRPQSSALNSQSETIRSQSSLKFSR